MRSIESWRNSIKKEVRDKNTIGRECGGAKTLNIYGREKSWYHRLLTQEQKIVLFKEEGKKKVENKLRYT